MCSEPRVVREVRASDSPASSFVGTLLFTGEEYAIVWLDDGTPGGVFFRRLAADGEPLETPLRVNERAGGFSAAMAWSGAEYGVAWAERVEPTGPVLDPSEIRFRALSRDGAPLDTETTVLGGGVFADVAALVFVNGSYGLLWHEDDLGLVSNSFALLDLRGRASTPYVLPFREDVSSFWFASDAAAIGAEVGIAMMSVSGEDPPLSWYTRLATAGSAPTVRVPLGELTEAGAPSLAWSGERLAVLVQVPAIEVGEFDASGDSFRPMTTLSTSTDLHRSAALAWGNGRIAVAFVVEERATFVELDGEGEIEHTIDLGPARVPAPATSVISLVWTGREYGVAWSDDREGDGDVYFARVDTCSAE